MQWPKVENQYLSEKKLKNILMKLPAEQEPYKYKLGRTVVELEDPRRTDRTGHIASGLMTLSCTKI